MKKENIGKLVYNEQEDKWYIKFDDKAYPLSNGDMFLAKLDKKWSGVRFQRGNHNRWYLITLNGNVILSNNLIKVKEIK